MPKILVTGASSGLGLAIASTLRDNKKNTVIEYDKQNGLDVTHPVVLDKDIDILINCAGVNGIAYVEDVTDELWDKVLNTNAKGIFKMTQAYLDALKKATQRGYGMVINIVSNAATVPMTASACYNASKGAAKILSAQLARELTRRFGITVFSISPNKLMGTGMSEYIDQQVCVTRGWTMEQAQAYQNKNLLWGHETNPIDLAKFIAWLVDQPGIAKNFTGCDIPFGL